MPPTQPSPAAVLLLLRKSSLSLALAESCTGGLVSHLLTEVPGSSDVYRGGVVAYADRIKIELLGVSVRALRQKGAVSREVALQMARGVRRRLKSAMGVAVTGIAGPGGGSARKPVGLVYVALADRVGMTVVRFQFRGSRSKIKRSAARAALGMILGRCRTGR